jgi:hypothetical protein
VRTNEGCRLDIYLDMKLIKTIKGKAMPLQALKGPEGSRRSRLTDLKTIDT